MVQLQRGESRLFSFPPWLAHMYVMLEGTKAGTANGKKTRDQNRNPECKFSPFLYSGRPVMSSMPSTTHPSVVCSGTTRLYASHCVSLWNGTSVPPSSCTEAVATALEPGLNLIPAGGGDDTPLVPEPGAVVVGCCSRVRALQGHTSPRGIPASDARAGQIGVSPWMSTLKRDEMWIFRPPSGVDVDFFSR